jgi:hypothetical protein
VTFRAVRFLPFFFDRLDDLLGESRDGEGGPSSTDFLLLDLPRIRDVLANEYEVRTTPIPPGNHVRAYIGSGVLVGAFALYSIIGDDGAIEVIDIELDGLEL